MTAVLADITGISELALYNSNMDGFSIAQRMSWASKRVTTRSEDIAYCLMGIFDVNMPLLYGEGGEKAFLRLQEELLRSSDDQSLFAWGHVQAPRSTFGQDLTQLLLSGSEKFLYPSDGQHLLAKSPANFARFGNVVPFHRTPESGVISLSNKGVQLTGLFIHHSANRHQDERHWCTALLDCQFSGDMSGPIGIHLGQCSNSNDLYSRTLLDPVVVFLALIPHAVQETIHVKGPNVTRWATRQPILSTKDEGGSLFVISKYTKRGDWKLAEVFPPEQWEERDGMFRPQSGRSVYDEPVGVNLLLSYSPRVIDPRSDSPKPVVIVLRYSYFAPYAFAIQAKTNSPLKSLIKEHWCSFTSLRDDIHATAVDEEKYGGNCASMKVRESNMLGKVLYFVDVDIWLYGERGEKEKI
jgi:hypothetical protein